MRSVLHTMDALLGYDDAAVRLHRSLLSLRGQPRALRSAEGGHVIGELLSLLDRIELDASNKNLDHLFLRKVALWSNSGRRICRDVMRIVRETSADSIRSATSVLDSLKQLCDDYGIKSVTSQSMDVDAQTSSGAHDLDCYQLALTPLNLLLFKLKQISTLSSVSKKDSEKWISFGIEFAPSHHLALTSQSQLPDDAEPQHFRQVRDAILYEALSELIFSNSMLHDPITWLQLNNNNLDLDTKSTDVVRDKMTGFSWLEATSFDA